MNREGLSRKKREAHGNAIDGSENAGYEISKVSRVYGEDGA